MNYHEAESYITYHKQDLEKQGKLERQARQAIINRSKPDAKRRKRFAFLPVKLLQLIQR